MTEGMSNEKNGGVNEETPLNGIEVTEVEEISFDEVPLPEDLSPEEGEKLRTEIRKDVISMYKYARRKNIPPEARIKSMIATSANGMVLQFPTVERSQ